MYFQFTAFYKRDVYFSYSEEKNEISEYDFVEGKKLETNNLLYYEVDKIDSYIDSHDLLPTFGPLLVSEKFKSLFKDMEGIELDFFNTEISDSKGNTNKNFYAINILNKISCMDMERSIAEKTSYGTLNVKKLFIIPNSLGQKNIALMKEHDSYIIVTEEFKKRCEESGLKGIDFVEEGHTIYTDL